MYLNYSICNVLSFMFLNHTSCGKRDVLLYGIEEADSIGLHEVTENCDLLVLKKYGFRNTCYIYRLHMLDISPHCFAF